MKGQEGESVNRQIFTGQEHDENTGLIYFGARYYDPDTARFITEDSYLGEQGTPPSLNRYLYAYSNPTVYIDLEGYYSLREFAGDASKWWKNTKHQVREAFKHPVEGVKGFLKDTANLVPQALELTIKSAGSAGLADMEIAAAMQSISGSDKLYNDIDQARKQVDQVSLPTFKMSNAAQEGGAKFATGVQVATGVGGLVKGGIKAAGKTTLKAGRKEMGASAKVGESAGEAGLTGEAANGGVANVNTKIIEAPCFVAGTLILTQAGAKTIESIKIGDYVLSRDEKAGTTGLQKVIRKFVKHDQDVIKTSFINQSNYKEELVSTHLHPFWVKDRGWISAVNLLPGDEVYTSNGGWMRVSSGTWVTHRQTVYNLEVDSTHTYFVGESGIWVHNQCAEPPIDSKQIIQDENVKWVKENAYMQDSARKYEASAPGAREGYAPALEFTDETMKTRKVKFDGIDGRTMVDRKISVTTFPKSKKQALRQSKALRQNDRQGRWEVPSPSEANRANKMFDQLKIDNIKTKVCPECD